MDQHPVPRQITTFEFKLIGFMTLRQFIYLVLFVPMGALLFKLIPIPLLNILVGGGVIFLGIALAFIPINDRPLDVWLKNFIRHLLSATQFIYHKENPPLLYFQNLSFEGDPHQIMAHVGSDEARAKYLASNPQGIPVVPATSESRHGAVAQILAAPPVQTPPPTSTASPPVPSEPATSPMEKKPVLVGVVKNNRRIPLPGILIYIKNPVTQVPIRLLKTNPHGIFATYTPLETGEYIFEMKDPKGGLFFDTMKIQVDPARHDPLEFYSKESI